MKKTVIMLVLMLSLSVVCSASPLMDFSQGKVAIDLSAQSGGDIKVEGEKVTDGKTNFLGAVTFGLGNNFALQYRNNTADSKDYSSNVYYMGVPYNLTLNTICKAQELNVLYKLDKNLAAFVGWTQQKAGVSASSGGVSGDFADTKNGYQVGLTGVANLGDKFSGYATVAAGNYNTNVEVGLSYEVAKNTELNVGYRDVKYKKMTINELAIGEFEYATSGLTYGLTFKF